MEQLTRYKTGQVLDIQKAISSKLESLQNPSGSVIENGTNALALIKSKPVSVETFTRAKFMLEQNYGTEIAPEKMAMLFDEIRKDNWTEERFERTLRWFLKNHKYPSWTIADWYSYSVKLYPYSWYLSKCQMGEAKCLQAYHVGESIAWGYKEFSDEIPFPKHEANNCKHCEKKNG